MIFICESVCSFRFIVYIIYCYIIYAHYVIIYVYCIITYKDVFTLAIFQWNERKYHLFLSNIFRGAFIGFPMEERRSLDRVTSVVRMKISASGAAPVELGEWFGF